MNHKSDFLCKSVLMRKPANSLAKEALRMEHSEVCMEKIKRQHEQLKIAFELVRSFSNCLYLIIKKIKILKFFMSKDVLKSVFEFLSRLQQLYKFFLKLTVQ